MFPAKGNNNVTTYLSAYFEVFSAYLSDSAPGVTTAVHIFNVLIGSKKKMYR